MCMISEASENITQGSIVDGVDFGFGENNPLGIVLSNACDFLNDKMGYVIVACLMPAKEILLDSKEFKNKIEGVGDDKKIGKKKWKTIQSFFDDYIHNKGVTRYYFIDPNHVVEAPYWFVDFQHIVSIPYAKIDNLENVAQLNSPFREQMMVHFASYTARIPVERIEDTTGIAKSFLESEFQLEIE